jgi:hypothetical protein
MQCTDYILQVTMSAVDRYDANFNICDSSETLDVMAWPISNGSYSAGGNSPAPILGIKCSGHEKMLWKNYKFACNSQRLPTDTQELP